MGKPKVSDIDIETHNAIIQMFAERKSARDITLFLNDKGYDFTLKEVIAASKIPEISQRIWKRMIGMVRRKAEINPGDGITDTFNKIQDLYDDPKTTVKEKLGAIGLMHKVRMDYANWIDRNIEDGMASTKSHDINKIMDILKEPRNVYIDNRKIEISKDKEKEKKILLEEIEE